MAAQSEGVNDGGAGATKAATNNGDGEGTEMTTLGDSADEGLKVTVHDNNVQEPSVLFVVKDTTDTNWQKSRYNYSLPWSTAVADLYLAIAKEAGYQEGSFLLAWYDKESNDPDAATPLSLKSTQTLYELEMPSEPQRCYLYLRDGPDSPPVKVTNTAGEGTASEGTGQVELATAVSTSPSSHAINNTSNSWSSTNYSNKSDTGFVGLVNQAMTCYLNSLLQTLYMTPEFRKALYSWRFSGDIGEGMKSIPYQLQRLFIHLQTSTKRAVETTGVTKSFGWDSSEAWQQHDVQELCRVMFDALEKRLRKDSHPSPELINELYQGDMKDYVKCLECNLESAREDHFLDIPLVIKPFGGSKAYSSVEEALNGFVDPETLSGDNQYYCDKCKKKCDAHKGLKFTRFPYLLTLQLKRFDFDYTSMHRIKLNDRMTFPSILNLNRFVDPSEKPEGKDLEEVKSLYEDFVIEKFGSRSYFIMKTPPDVEEEKEGAELLRLMEMLSQGPYVYELFSIMIHSGSAIGGHYYAYIKSFCDRQWYCFNDQSVTRVSHDDIEQTFGGSDRSRGYYSSVYASSANAYMLMYRRVDKEKNDLFLDVECLPEHVSQQILEEQQHELREKERQEWERHLCKFRVFMRHLSTNEMVERKLEVHKDKSLRDATEEAYKALGLGKLVPLERCRLIKFDEYAETLDQSFDAAQQDESFGYHVGGARSYYSFELFMEIHAEGEQFKVYNKGGLNVKVLLIDLANEDVGEPVQFRAEQGWTVAELKAALAQRFGWNAGEMNVALETYQNEGKELNNPTSTLKSEGFYRKHTVFVCCDAEDMEREFQQSAMNRVIDKYANSISLFVTVPPPPLPPRLPPPLPPGLTNGVEEGFEDSFVEMGARGSDMEAQGVTSEGCVASEGVNDCAGDSDQKAQIEAQNNAEQSETYERGGASDGGGGACVGAAVSISTEGNVTSEGSNADEGGRGGSLGSGEGAVTSEGSTAGEGVVTSEGSTAGEGGRGGSLGSGEGAVTSEGNTCGGSSEGVVENTSCAGSRDGVVSERNAGGGGVFLEGNSGSEERHLASGGGETSEGSTGGVCVTSEGSAGGVCVTSEGSTGGVCVTSEGSAGSKESVATDGNAQGESGKRPLQRTVTIHIDRRKTLGDLKKQLEDIVQVPATEFKIYRVYSNNQEYEVFRLQDTLQSVPHETKMIVRLGRALLPGEFRIKLSLLRISEVEYFKSLMDSIVAKGMTVCELKHRLVKEAYEQGIEFPLQVDRLRLRKKTWRSPGTVYLDHQVFEKDIHVFANYEMFIEPLEGVEPMKHATQMQVYVRHWHPRTYTVDKTQEVILDENTPDHLKRKLSDFSGIPAGRIQFAKAFGSFPCEMSILDLEGDLEWNPEVSTINSSPLAIYDDGAILYFKDSEEKVADLTTDRKTKLQKQEHSRLSKYNTSGSSTYTRYPHRPEKALKIWTEDDDDVNRSSQTTSES